MVEKYLSAIKANVKFYFLPHLLVSMIYILLIPIFFGTEYLDSRNVIKLLELFVSIIGIICLVPIYFPEQYDEIYHVVLSKHMSMIKIYSIRIMLGFLWFALLLCGILMYLRLNHSEVLFIPHFFGTFATGIFLGSLGILTYTLFDNIAIAYMVPLVYYISNFGGSAKYFGKFILFSMSRGSITEKYYLFIGSLMMIIISLVVKYKRRR